MKYGLLVLALVFSTAMTTSAQSSGDVVVDRIGEAYRQLEYDRAEALARRALANYSDFTVEQLADIHVFAALIAYNRSELAEARRQFLSALELVPGLELDPILVAPKVQTYFADLRAEVASESTDVGLPAARYVMVQDPRADAALRSMLVPGWGQLYKGHRMKGAAMGVLFATAATGAIVGHVRRQGAESNYRSASTSAEAAARYDTFNTWHRVRNGMVQGAALIWATSVIDALLSRPAMPSEDRVSLRVAPSSLTLHVDL